MLTAPFLGGNLTKESKKKPQTNKQTQLYQEATAMKCTLKACLLGDRPTHRPNK